MGTVAGVGVLVVLGSHYAWTELQGSPDWLRWLIPLALLIGCFIGLLRVVNSKKPADFMIATEGEMKKVSWSSKKEIVGSTKVVIVTLLIMGAILFFVDLAFRAFFKFINVQQF